MSTSDRTISIFCDGLCEPKNPGGYACWAFVALTSDGRILANDYGCIGHGPSMTNNVAEYRAVLNALNYAAAQGWHDNLLIRTDSQLVIKQIVGEWACNSAALRPLCRQAQVLGLQLGALFEWIPRTQNAQADALSRRAFVEAQRQARGLHTHVTSEVAA